MVNQPVRLLVSVRTYQAANSVFLSQQTSTSQAYQPRNQPANKPNMCMIKGREEQGFGCNQR